MRSAPQRRAVIEQAILAVCGLYDLIDAKEAAQHRHAVEAGLPQAGQQESERDQGNESRQAFALQEHERCKRDQHDLESQFGARRQFEAEPKSRRDRKHDNDQHRTDLSHQAAGVAVKHTGKRKQCR
jgi:hypothetical protein